MAKKVMQDVVRKAEPVKKKKEEGQIPFSVPEAPAKKGGFLKKLFWFCIFVAVIFLGAVILVNLSSATVKITPHQEFLNVSTSTALKFETVELEQDGSQTVSATKKITTDQKAEGEVVIYNTYSAAPQKLLVNTRLAAPDGKIFRTEKAVTIPGNGSVEVTVLADQPGPEYNIGLVDFTIVGFKGTPKYTKIYGRSKTEMSGGARANSFVADEKDVSSARNFLQSQIKNSLSQRIIQEEPADYILYQKAIDINFTESVATTTVSEKGLATGYLLRKDDLSNFLTNSQKGVSVINLDKLDFEPVSENATTTEITFNLKGTAHLVWNVDTDSLAAALMGVKDKNYQNVFQNYPNIERAEIFFAPSWWPWMPNSKSRIHFETVLTSQ